MKMMIAFRRVSTPTTPIVNSTAEKRERFSEHRLVSCAAEHDGADDGGQQQDARELEREQVLVNSGWAIGADRARSARPASAT